MFSQFSTTFTVSAGIVNGEEAAIGPTEEPAVVRIDASRYLPGPPNERLPLLVYHHRSWDSNSANKRKTCGDCGVLFRASSERHEA